MHSLTSRLDYFQKKLRLHDWELALTKEPPKTQGAIMEIGRVRERKVANIRCHRDRVDDLTQEQLDNLLLHELMHLIFDPMELEFEMQIKFSNRRREHLERFKIAREQTVQRVANILSTAYNN